MPPIAARSSTDDKRLQLLFGGKHRAADQAVEIGAFGDQRVEALEIGFDRVDRVRLAGKLEQRGGIAAGHGRDVIRRIGKVARRGGNDGFVAGQDSVLVKAFFGAFSAKLAPGANGRCKPFGFKRDLDSAGAAEKPAIPRKSRRLLT